MSPAVEGAPGVGEDQRDALARHLMFRHAFGMSEQEREKHWRIAKRQPAVMRYWRDEANGILQTIAAAPGPDRGEAERLLTHYNLPAGMSLSGVVDYAIGYQGECDRTSAEVNAHALKMQERATAAEARAERADKLVAQLQADLANAAGGMAEHTCEGCGAALMVDEEPATTGDVVGCWPYVTGEDRHGKCWRYRTARGMDRAWPACALTEAIGRLAQEGSVCEIAQTGKLIGMLDCQGQADPAAAGRAAASEPYARMPSPCPIDGPCPTPDDCWTQARCIAKARALITKEPT